MKFNIVARSCFSWTLAALLFFLGAGARVAPAQSATATISGTVTDASGAAVPDAAVQVRNIGTGTTQSVKSDAQGRPCQRFDQTSFTT